MKKKFVIYAVLALFVAVSASCESDNVRVEADRATFERQRALWEESWNNHSRNLSGESWNYVHYQFTYTFCSGFTGTIGPVTVTVREGKDAVIENNGDSYHIPERATFESMEDVFNFLSRRFDMVEDVRTNFPDARRIVFEIEYCNQHHFPKCVYFGVSFSRPTFGGPDLRLTVTDFKRLD